MEYVQDMKNDLEILYEDNHIIVVVKPFNILSQSDDTKDIDMLTLIKSYLKEKYYICQYGNKSAFQHGGELVYPTEDRPNSKLHEPSC